MGIIHPCFPEEKLNLIPEIAKIVRKFGGNINPCYGIGLAKKELVDINDKRLIESMKKRLDPSNKFNQSKII